MYQRNFTVFANVTKEIPKNLHFSGIEGSDDTTPIVTFEKDKKYIAVEVNDDYLVAKGEDGEEYRIGGDGDGTAYWNDSEFRKDFRLFETPIKVIETDVWEADPEKKGYLKFVRLKTIEEVYKEANQFLKEQFLYDRLDYFLVSGSTNKEDKAEFPKWRWIACYAVVGGSEGHYIHVDALTVEGKFVQIFTGKTFLGMNFALEVSNALTKVFWDEMK
jgi:hypothetical protein